VKITAVTPGDAASSPQHPDHDRWVKETTLAVEVKHAERVGKTLRDAEAENAYWLARADAKAKEPARQPAPRRPRAARMQDRGVTVGTPKISKLKPSPCGRCGVCRNCMRERRVLLIMQKRKDDAQCAALADPLIRASYRLGRFANLSKGDYERAVTAACEAACDASIPRLGEWK
jgi:hypothetical protein